MAVYGDMMAAFPELYRRITVWTAADKSDSRTIVGIYLPTKGDKLKRWKYSNRGTAIDYADDDVLFVKNSYRDKIKEGDFFYDPDDKHICRVMGDQNFSHPGGFIVFSVERVTGANHDQQEPLQVKEAQFA